MKKVIAFIVFSMFLIICGSAFAASQEKVLNPIQKRDSIKYVEEKPSDVKKSDSKRVRKVAHIKNKKRNMKLNNIQRKPPIALVTPTR